MSEIIKKLLKGAGYPDDVITSAEKDEKFDAQKAIEAVNQAHKEHYRSLLENEIKEEVKDDIIKDRDGKMLKILNTELKRRGAPLEEIETLEIKDKIKIAAEYWKAEGEKASGKVNEDFKKIQEENLNLKNQLAEKEESFTQRVKEVESKYESERKAEKIDATLQKRFTNVPAAKLLGGEHNEGYYNGLRTYMEKHYDIDYDKDEVLFLEKGTKKRAVTKTDGREVWKSADDVIIEGLKTYKWIVESNGTGGQGQPDPAGGANGSGVKKSPRLIEMENKIAAEKTA